MHRMQYKLITLCAVMCCAVCVAVWCGGLCVLLFVPLYFSFTVPPDHGGCCPNRPSVLRSLPWRRPREPMHGWVSLTHTRLLAVLFPSSPVGSFDSVCGGNTTEIPRKKISLIDDTVPPFVT
mmetsp:Transcript_27317/g.29465  ORF Transcript_27317/g.29465 Transcript_27317/m.29465 type:complete len:122 (-) Transcript_27317:35-400(-)